MLLLWCVTGNLSVVAAEGIFTLYLVRHAEKQLAGGRDPNLSAPGEQRAKRLAQWLLEKNIEAIWSSDFRRTRDTARPLQVKLGLELNIYAPREQPALVKVLQHRQRNALVVGHSNTIPELARLLCACSIADMDESEYGRLIIITIAADEITVETRL